jgi:hypothetical protein
MDCIFNLLKIDDDEILHSTLEALIEIIKVNFRYMSLFINKFVDTTTELISKHNSDQRISSFSIEIWNTLFEEDINNEKLNKG